jgi:hypothetical protein
MLTSADEKRRSGGPSRDTGTIARFAKPKRRWKAVERPIPKRMVRPFLESIRDFNREARNIDPKREAKRIKSQEDKEEVEELLMHAARIKGAADRR